MIRVCRIIVIAAVAALTGCSMTLPDTIEYVLKISASITRAWSITSFSMKKRKKRKTSVDSKGFCKYLKSTTYSTIMASVSEKLNP